jgi:small-conductance mechanosensitive channel
MALRFGKRGRWSDYPFKRVILIIRRILGVLFAVLSVLLALLAISTVLVYIIDGGKNYTDWVRSPLIMLVLSLFLFAVWALVNYDRIALLSFLRRKKRGKELHDDADLLELD